MKNDSDKGAFKYAVRTVTEVRFSLICTHLLKEKMNKAVPRRHSS